MTTHALQIARSFTRILPVLALATLLPGLTWAQNLYNAQDKTLFAANEAALTAQTELTQELGGSGNLAVNGTFSSNGWTLSLSGSQGGVPVSLQYIGSYDPNANTSMFQSAGTVGGNSWTGSGTVLFTDASQSEFKANINVQAAFLLGNVPKKPDTHTLLKWKKFWNKNGYRYGKDFGIWFYTENGKIVGGPHFERSSARMPLDPALDGSQQVCITHENCVATTFNIDGGTFSGNATTTH
jgi:hypothetical protein